MLNRDKTLGSCILKRFQKLDFIDGVLESYYAELMESLWHAKK